MVVVNFLDGLEVDHTFQLPLVVIWEKHITSHTFKHAGQQTVDAHRQFASLAHIFRKTFNHIYFISSTHTERHTYTQTHIENIHTSITSHIHL